MKSEDYNRIDELLQEDKVGIARPLIVEELIKIRNALAEIDTEMRSETPLRTPHENYEHWSSIHNALCIESDSIGELSTLCRNVRDIWWDLYLKLEAVEAT